MPWIAAVEVNPAADYELDLLATPAELGARWNTATSTIDDSITRYLERTLEPDGVRAPTLRIDLNLLLAQLIEDNTPRTLTLGNALSLILARLAETNAAYPLATTETVSTPIEGEVLNRGTAKVPAGRRIFYT